MENRKTALEDLRNQLLQRREALRQALQGNMTLLLELSKQSEGDLADIASDSTNHEINSQLASAQSQEIRQISRALGEMSKGTYGQCEFCNKSISLPRLHALPYTTFCIECAREAELEAREQRDTVTFDTSDPDGDHDYPSADMELMS